MNILIVYDSQFGNTQKVAETIASSLDKKHTTQIFQANKVKGESLKNTNLLIIGSPTQGGRPTPAIANFINNIPKDMFKSLQVACFDTRIPEENVNFALKILLKVIDYASTKMAQTLVSKGAKLITPPQAFYVKDKKGPLLKGELEKAESWVQTINSKLKAS